MTDELRSEMEAWLDALYAWNERKNLTRVPREEAWTRHIEDSLTLLPWIRDDARVADLGTGPGLPAWPIAAARPDVRVLALDSNGKMLDFLRSTPRRNLVVAQARAEDVEPLKADVVTGRAIAPLPIQLELSVAHARKGGLIVPLRSIADRELIPRIDLVALGLELADEQVVRVGETERYLPVFVRSGPLRRGFPRRWSEMKSKPLIRPA